MIDNTIPFLPLAAGQLPDGQFDVASQFPGEPCQFELFRLLGGIAIILLGGNLRGIDSRLRSAQADPHLLVLTGRAVRHVDGENLRPFLVGQAEQGLDLVELVHVLALVKENLAVAVVDDSALDDGGRDDVLHLLRDHHRLAEELADRLE